MKTYLMNLNMGSVDTEDNWKEDWCFSGCDEPWEMWSKDLVEVVRDEHGNWVKLDD